MKTIVKIIICLAIVVGLSGSKSDQAELAEINDLIQKLNRKHDYVSGNAADELKKYGELAIDPLMDALDGANVNFRKNIAFALSRIHDDRVIDALLYILEHDVAEVCETAAFRLSELNNRKATPGLMKILEKSEDTDVKMYIIEALYEIADERAVETVRPYLASSVSTLREYAINYLGIIQDEESVESIIILLNDEDEMVILSAVEALGKIKNVKAVKPLLDVLKKCKWEKRRWRYHHSDPEEDICRRVIHALRDIKDTSAVVPIMESLKDSSVSVVAASINALGEMRDARAVIPLIGFLQDTIKQFATNSIKALSKIGDKRAIEPLQNILEQRFDDKVINALRSLGWEPKTNREKVFYYAASHEWNELVQMDTIAIEPLLYLLKNVRTRDYRKIAWVLGEIGDKRAVLPICDRLKYNVNPIFLSAILKLSDTSAIEPLVSILMSGKYSPKKLNALAQLLDSLGWTLETDTEKAYYAVANKTWDKSIMISPETIKPLLSSLNDRSEEVIDFSREIISDLGASAERSLNDYLQSDIYLYRVGALEGLYLIQADNCIDETVKALTDENFRVRKKAVYILDNLNWTPQTDKQKIDYCAAADEWDSCFDLEVDATEELSNFIENSGYYFTFGRTDALQALVRIDTAHATKVLRRCLGKHMFPDRIAMVLEQIGWQPETIRDSIYFDHALYSFIGYSMEDSLWELAKPVLFEDLLSSDTLVMRKSLTIIFNHGDESVIPELISILEKHGNELMAKWFAECGHIELLKVAEKWSFLHNIKLSKKRGGVPWNNYNSKPFSTYEYTR
jgi:HEAT repeat protein